MTGTGGPRQALNLPWLRDGHGSNTFLSLPSANIALSRGLFCVGYDQLLNSSLPPAAPRKGCHATVCVSVCRMREKETPRHAYGRGDIGCIPSTISRLLKVYREGEWVVSIPFHPPPSLPLCVCVCGGGGGER